tara:strand:- start:125 stop:283 length:159 start_codon:yes stop_codon:yes gene_type:complete
MDVVSKPDDPFIVGKNHPVNFTNLAFSSNSTNTLVLGRESIAKAICIEPSEV